MKFNMMIGGVETIFPEVEARYFKDENRIIIYSLKNNQRNLDRIKKNINNSIMKFEGGFIILLLKDFQYAFSLEEYEDLISLYNAGVGVGFAFEDENGKLLGIPTPTFYK